MGKDSGGPAFPVPETKIEDCCLAAAYQGMSLRDWYAGMALQGYLTSKSQRIGESKPWYQDVAERSYFLADAMIKARES